MKTLPVRLTPGQDLRAAVERAVMEQDCRAAFVLSGIGSLSVAALRFAGAARPQMVKGDTEILSLGGTIAVEMTPAGLQGRSHLHMALSTATGQVFGGHVMPGCIVRTTAEILLALLPEWTFTRERDDATGFPELVVQPGLAKNAI